jgi:hypothetical protein
LALLSLATAACNAPSSGGAGDNAAPAASQPQAQVAGNLLYVMRSILFPNSNIIFDTQTNDPGAPKKDAGGPPGAGAGASAAFANIYTGWPAVESSAVALAEAANLIMLPGRVCSNGKPVPVEQEDFKKFNQGLREAGLAALKAAQSKSQDAMVEVSGTVADACAACHEVYRDIGPAGGPERCSVPVK